MPVNKLCLQAVRYFTHHLQSCSTGSVHHDDMLTPSLSIPLASLLRGGLGRILRFQRAFLLFGSLVNLQTINKSLTPTKRQLKLASGGEARGIFAGDVCEQVKAHGLGEKTPLGECRTQCCTLQFVSMYFSLRGHAGIVQNAAHSDCRIQGIRGPETSVAPGIPRV